MPRSRISMRRIHSVSGLLRHMCVNEIKTFVRPCTDNIWNITFAVRSAIQRLLGSRAMSRNLYGIS
eukprot:1971729-Pleurochrysis_carterae.AAC.1